MIPRLRERSPPASKVYAVLLMLLVAHGHGVSAQIFQAESILSGASSTAVASGTPPPSSPATEQAIAAMLAAAFNNAASQGAGAGSVPQGSQPAASVPAVDAAEYPELTTLLNNNVNASDPLGLRDAVTKALSQQQGAGDVYAAQLEEAAGVINGFTTPLQFGTLGSVRNYITRVIQVNTLLGSIQRYLTPTSQLAAQRLLFDGIRLSINFVTTFPVAFLVYLSRIFLAARDLVQIPRDSTNIAISSLNLIVFISTNPVNFAGINAGLGPGGLFTVNPARQGSGGFIGPGGTIFGPASGVGTGIGASAGKRLLGVSEQFHELMAQLEAAGISTRDLLEEGAQPSFTTRDAPADVAPVAPLTRVLELSHLIVEMLSKVQEAGDAVIPDLESVLTMDDTYDFRERRFGGDPLAAVSQGMEEISRQVSGTAKALVFEVMRATGLSTVVDTTLGKPGADSPDGLCILPPITSVNRDNVGNGTNGLPPGVIGLPAVPQVGLPGLPFPAGFPATPPAFNPAVLNLLRTISTALGLAFSILNLAQTILEAISDILAVPPAGIALITGPILFEIISVDYYNQLVAAFPAVPNGYLTDLNTALGGIGARLTNPDNVYLGYQPLQAALGNLRSSLSSLGTVQGTLQGLVGDAA